MKGPLELGEVLDGRYEVKGFVGEGGMQHVYLAADLVLEREVAIKTPKNASAAKRFKRSAVVAARVNHPNVAKTLDYFETNGRAFLAEELIVGADLASAALSQLSTVDPYLAAKVFHYLAKGIAAAHHAGVIHRDLKPTNVMVTGGVQTSDIKITDFGIAKLAEEELIEAVDGGSESLSMSATAVGALPYMSPEAIDTPRDVGYPTDIWSLGAMMFHIVTGTPPYGTGLRIVAKILEAAPPTFPPHITSNPQFRPLAEVLIGLIAKCMSKNPFVRPSADELVAEISEICYSTGFRYSGRVSRLKFGAYGFIETDEGDVFFHLSSVFGRKPELGDRVVFCKHEGGGASRAHPVVLMR